MRLERELAAKQLRQQEEETRRAKDDMLTDIQSQVCTPSLSQFLFVSASVSL